MMLELIGICKWYFCLMFKVEFFFCYIKDLFGFFKLWIKVVFLGINGKNILISIILVLMVKCLFLIIIIRDINLIFFIMLVKNLSIGGVNFLFLNVE